MSLILDVYAIDLHRLRRTVGSGDEALCARVLAHDAVQARFDLDDDPEPGRPSIKSAVRDLVMGSVPSDTTYPDIYGFALEALCLTLSNKALPNAEWSGIHNDTIALFDHWLREFGVSEPVAFLLTYGESPVPLPDIGDYPQIGTLEAGDVRRLRDELRVLAAPTTTEWPATALAEMLGWFDEAIALSRPHEEIHGGLVGFLS